jgi:hypothetical protein
LYQQALSSFREAGDLWGCARSLTDLGAIDCVQGRYPSAQTSYREAIEIFMKLGHRRGIARAMEGHACLAVAQDQAARALKLAAAAAHLRELIRVPLPQAEKAKLDQMLLPAWQALSGPASKTAWAEGSAMDLEKAVQYALQEPESSTQV